jgi:mannose-6-phosphate isomerase-like protein (cupin superfamily)
VELRAVTRDEARVYELPGRDWIHYIGPEINGAQNLTIGYSVFPPDSAPEGHVHPTQEEVIYIISGRGELVTPEGTAILAPGTCVYIPVGLHHQTVSHGPDPLEMVTSFSPPVAPGSYEEDDQEH